MFVVYRKNVYFSFFEPTCAYCTVGSYMSISVRLSLDQLDWIINHNFTETLDHINKHKGKEL